MKIQTAHSILLVSGKYVLQLRDNKNTIATPGQWSLFGGRIDGNETPLETIRREVEEELTIQNTTYKKLWFIDYYSEFTKSPVRTWFFVSDITRMWLGHKLTEGRAAGLFSFKELKKLDIPLVMRDALNRFYIQNLKKDENTSCGFMRD